MAAKPARTSPADVITKAIIERLEAGVRPWIKPWTGSPAGRPLRYNGQPYRGINCFWLWMAADMAGYGSRSWMTYKQSQALGGQVREGEHSQIAIFYKSYTKKAEPDALGEGADEQRRVLRAYAVFNADQIEGLPDQFYARPVNPVPPTDELPERAQRFLKALPMKIHHRGQEAFYDRISDSITLPPVELFESRAKWAATLAHEAGHWTGHPDRLNREFGKRFGDKAYGFEELCAELTASLIGAHVGLPADHLENHAAYIQSWIKILKSDSRAVLTAAARAEAAAEYLLRITGLGAEEERDEGEGGEPLARAA